MVATRYDVVIVGGGSAGCVLAARLSECPDRSVLLIEAGPDYPAGDPPQALLDAAGPHVTSHMWDIVGEPVDGGPTLTLPRGRVMGGCSAINAAFALRGSPADYDAWAAAGLTGWSFADVLPHFIALENDLDFGDRSHHGDSGPIPIRRYPAAERSREASAGLTAMAANGIPEIEDHNAPGAVGVSALPVNAVAGRRMSTALTYLAIARGRTNLHVRPDTTVQHVRIEGGRATGVVLAGSGAVIAAGTVIVSAGTYHSPGVLIRSGVGAAADLRALAIEPVVDLPGVGQNLVDHPAVSVDLDLHGDLVDGPRFQVVATLHSSGSESADPPDLQLVGGGPFRNEEGGGAFFIGAALLKPNSRGTVRLRSADAQAPPEVELGYFREDDDLVRLAEGARRAHAVAGDPALRAVSRARVTPELSGTELRTWLRQSVWTYHHPVGTCRMGIDPDDGAVVDAAGRVFGVDNLYVVDASIMPDVPSANTNIPTIMVAERLAAEFAGPAG